jgi:hypothetical protein
MMVIEMVFDNEIHIFSFQFCSNFKNKIKYIVVYNIEKSLNIFIWTKYQ